MKTDNRPRIYYGYIVVAVACFILVITQGTFFSFSVFFKPLSGDFGWTRAMTSGAFSLCSILSGLFLMVTGRLNDRIGPRFVMTVGVLFLGSGYLLMSRIGVLWQLYIFYGVLIAIGLSGGFTPLTSTVSRWFVKRRSLMTGIVAAGTGIGTLIIPPLANWLIITYDWRQSYVIIGIGTIAILIVAAQFLRRDPSQVGQLPDGEREAKVDDTGSQSMGLSFSETTHKAQFWMLVMSKVSSGFCTMVVMVHIIPHATDFGISATKAASIIAIIGGAGIIGRIMMGSVGDRIGNKKALSTCIILVALAFTLILSTKGLWVFYLFAAIFGFAYGGAATMTAPLVADLFGLRSHGAIYGSIGFGLCLGNAAGPVVAGQIFDVTGSYQLAFLTCIILSIIALVLVLFLRPTIQQNGETGVNK